LTTENTKNNTAKTDHLLSNSSQQIFIFQNDFSIETTDDILDEDETANLSGDESLTHLKATIDTCFSSQWGVLFFSFWYCHQITNGCSRHGFKTVLYFCSTDPFSKSAVLGLQSFPVLGVFLLDMKPLCVRGGKANDITNELLGLPKETKFENTVGCIVLQFLVLSPDY
jgi:hypothetical protein